MSQRLASLLWIALLLATRLGVPPESSFGNDTALEQLRDVQSKVQRVVRDTLPACVAISDGIGFGSGVVVSSTGHILTAGHVVNTGTQKLDVYFPDGRIVKARLLGYNLNVDAAMIQIIDPGPWPHVPVAASTEHLQSGDWLVSLGHSGGYEVGRNPPVRSGRLLERRGHQLVTDAVLIGGDSGGPLFDLGGQLVAIHSSIGDTVAENRHVSIDAFRKDWNRMAAGERWGKLPDLDTPGPEPDDGLSPAQADHVTIALLGVELHTHQDQAVVQRVQPQSPAERVGIKPGDILKSLDGTSIRTADDARQLFQRKSSGQSAAVTVLRNGRTLNLQIILDRLK